MVHLNIHNRASILQFSLLLALIRKSDIKTNKMIIDK